MNDIEKLIEEAERRYPDIGADPGTFPTGWSREQERNAFIAGAVFEKAHTPTSRLEYYDPARQDSIAEHDCVYEDGTWWFGHGMECKHPELHAHTPTGAEREALVRRLEDEISYRVRTAVALHKGGHDYEEQVVKGRASVRQIADGFRRSEVPEPSADDEEYDARLGDGDRDDPEPEGEPSDALCGDWPAPCNCNDPETHDGSVPSSLVRGEKSEPTDAEVNAATGEYIAQTGVHPGRAPMRAALRAASAVN